MRPIGISPAQDPWKWFVSIEQVSGRTFVPRWLEQVGDGTVVAHTAFRWVAPTLSQLRNVPGVGSLEITRRSPWGGVTSPPLTAILGTDGAPATIEEIRDRAPWGIEIMAASDWRRRLYAIGPASEYEAVRRGLMVLSLFLIAVNGAR